MNEYMFKGVKGFLLEVDNPKVKNINPINSNNYYNFDKNILEGKFKFKIYKY